MNIDDSLREKLSKIKDQKFEIDKILSSNILSTVYIRGFPIVCLNIDDKDRVCLAQVSNTLLKKYSYNEIHNRRVALGINCIQCTAIQLEILRSAGAMPTSSRRCGMITIKEAERLIRSFLDENKPPDLPENFMFEVEHKCEYGCRGIFYPSRYNSSRAKCIQCVYCKLFFSPNKFIFHTHKQSNSKYQTNGNLNFNSWRKHIFLINEKNDEYLNSVWEDVKSIFNSGKRKRGFIYNEDEESDSESNFNESLEEDCSEAKKKFEHNTNQLSSSISFDYLALFNFLNPIYINHFRMSNFSRLDSTLNDQQSNQNSKHASKQNSEKNINEKESINQKKKFYSITQHFN